MYFCNTTHIVLHLASVMVGKDVSVILYKTWDLGMCGFGYIFPKLVNGFPQLLLLLQGLVIVFGLFGHLLFMSV